MAEQFCLRWNNHQSTLVSVFEKLLENETLIDCTLWAEGQVLRAHKVVLSACSPTFESMLCVQEDKHPIIFLKDVKYLELKAMLDYMYKGEVNISQDQLDSFLKTAEALQVKGLTDQGGGGGDEPPAKKGPGRKAGMSDAPESPLVGNAPLREGSISPLGSKRRRRVARRHSAEESESNDCDMQAPAAPPQAVPAESAARLAPPTPTPQPPPPIIKKEVLQELITPKTEYTEEQPEEIEDLTLDDDDDYGEMSKPGTSFSLSQGSTSQDFSQWQQMTDDRTRDEVFMSAQEAINNQSNAQGTDSCKWLLSGGKYKGDMEWQPYGCMIHQYSQLDTRRCIRALAFLGTHNHFIFIGDTRILEIYTAFLEHLMEQKPFEERQSLTLSPRNNHTFSDAQLRVTVDFIWSPFISKVMVDSFKKWMDQLEPPSLIVAGCGTESILRTNSSIKGVKDYIFNLTKLVRPIDVLSMKKSKVLWMLLEPVNEEKFPKQWSGITNRVIDQYNMGAREVLSHSKAQVWSSTRALLSGFGGWDGLSIPTKALKHHTQILANLHCNDQMAFNDGTCCSSPERTTIIQRLTYSGIAVCCLLGLLVVIRRKKTKMKMDPPTKAYTLIVSLAKMGVIMAYFFLCDRTNFFMKENKYYSPISFWLPLGYVFALGLFFTEDSRYTKFLHRDQTDEWKGWMQLVLLIYNMTGASTNLHIRNHVQILVSAYFFLSGYCHFYYLWHRQDAGIVRFFQVIFRFNLLPVLLCLCMNRPYQFYAFAPLISFWFMLVFLVLTLPPRVYALSVESNPLHYLYLILKLVGLFSLIIILFMSEVFFEKVFVTRPWKALFVTTDDDIHDWWVRWKMNRYSMCYGVIFGLALITGQRYGIIDDSNHSNLMSKRPALAITFLSLVGLAAASGYAFLCPNSSDCDEVHSYSTFVPIISYIVLRNVNGTLRSRFSSLFAWFGKISLELCFCQYHIWMAADSHGVLVFVPGYPVLNVLITSFIFVCAAHEIHNLTYILLPYAVPSDWRKVLRNFFIFLCLLVPIGIHDGMF